MVILLSTLEEAEDDWEGPTVTWGNAVLALQYGELMAVTWKTMKVAHTDGEKAENNEVVEVDFLSQSYRSGTADWRQKRVTELGIY